MQHRSTAQRLKLVGEGDKDALAELYLELKRPIYLLAYSMLRSHALAEDIMQDTFVKVMGAAQSYKPQGSARAWVLRIAENSVIDLIRRERRSTPLVEDAAHKHQELQEVESSLDFLKATEQLSDRDKSILIYKVFSELTHAEIAEAVGMTAGAVRVRYRRILKRLEGFYRQRS